MHFHVTAELLSHVNPTEVNDPVITSLTIRDALNKGIDSAQDELRLGILPNSEQLLSVLAQYFTSRGKHGPDPDVPQYLR